MGNLSKMSRRATSQKAAFCEVPTGAYLGRAARWWRARSGSGRMGFVTDAESSMRALVTQPGAGLVRAWLWRMLQAP